MRRKELGVEGLLGSSASATGVRLCPSHLHCGYSESFASLSFASQHAPIFPHLLLCLKTSPCCLGPDRRSPGPGCQAQCCFPLLLLSQGHKPMFQSWELS